MKRSDTRHFFKGAPLWFHNAFQKFSLEYDINDLLTWTPKKKRPRLYNENRQSGFNRVPDWQDYDLDIFRVNDLRDTFESLKIDRQKHLPKLLKRLDAADRAEYDKRCAYLKSEHIMQEEWRVMGCQLKNGRDPRRRSDRRHFTQGMLFFRIYS